ncbi:MAG TPA: hypothetical protein VLJ62_07475, partial [Burkholderiaceae bacterium]|nr:hypothetical protein [Burkholderiaceae bacterium]
MRLVISAGLMLALSLPSAPARAQAAPTATEIAALRAEINALRESYEARLQALDARLRAAEAAANASTPASSAKAAPASGPATAAEPMPAAAPAPVAPTTAAASSSNTFNPAISLILSGTAAHTSLDPARYAITGFALPPDVEVGPPPRSFSLGETELAISASIDPWWRGAAFIALEPDNSVSLEEAFVQTTALGSGFTAKAGRYLSGIGYLNSQHAHTWDFADLPLAYQAMLAGQFADDGLQLRWLAPTDQFIELGVEVGRGQNFPGADSSRNGAGAASIALHTGGDVGDSHSWRAGVS